MDQKLTYLKNILKESPYTTALCGSGMMEEGGFTAVKKQDRAYEIEKTYGFGPEELYSSAFYSTRPNLFFQFYKNEMLTHQPAMTASGPALAAMEQAGLLHSIITSNIYDIPRRGGCKHVINLHGSIYENQCPHCKQMYSLEFVMNSPHTVPLCEHCKLPVRPLVSLFGEMVDSQRMSRAIEEVSRADVLLLLGTTLDSEVFEHYIRSFAGSHLIIIHKEPHYLDEKASLVFSDHPMHVLPKLLD